jgi:hypothetical protein
MQHGAGFFAAEGRVWSAGFETQRWLREKDGDASASKYPNDKHM